MAKKKKGILKKIGKAAAAVATGGVSLAASKKGKAKIKAVAKKAKNKGVFKKVGKIGAAVLTGGVSLLADKKVKGKIKKVTKKVGAKVKAAAKKANPIKVLKKVANAAKKGAEFAALLPFMIPMELALKAKGIKVKKPRKPKEVASLFYVNVVQKQHLEHCEHLDGEQSGEVALGVAQNLYRGSHHNVVADAAAGISKGIITAILDFFTAKRKQKELAEKEAKGEPILEEDKLTEEEKAAVGTDTEYNPSQDAAMIKSFDEAQDTLVSETGGLDSEGNETEPSAEIEEAVAEQEAQEENITGKKETKKAPVKTTSKTPAKEAAEEGEERTSYGVMRFFSHRK